MVFGHTVQRVVPSAVEREVHGAGVVLDRCETGTVECWHSFCATAIPPSFCAKWATNRPDYLPSYFARLPAVGQCMGRSISGKKKKR